MMGTQLYFNEPENSRIFIQYDKNHPISEIEFKEMFGKFGYIENIYIVKDRYSDNVKGIAYIKYSKASEAFKAIEAMHGHKIDSSNLCMKVILATSPGQERNNSDNQHKTLFVFVPKTAKKTDLEKFFSQFGDIFNVDIVTKKDTGESNGIAFINYAKSSSAALAIEECGPNYQAVFAKPKHDGGAIANPPSSSRHIDFKNPTSNYALLAQPSLPPRKETRVLTAYTSPTFTYNAFYKIVNIVPDLESVKELPRQQQVYDTKVFQVVYNTIASAEHAVNRINGFEYPRGHPITLEFSSTCGSVTTSVAPLANKIPKDIEALDATKNATITTAMSNDYRLPLAPIRGNEKVLSRSRNNLFKLFFICKPVIPPIDLLENSFKTIKGLRSFYVIDGKNYGNVTYDSLESATRAINCLNNTKVYNSRLTIVEFEPREPNRKRMKHDTM